jgi:hypothetical protein
MPGFSRTESRSFISIVSFALFNRFNRFECGRQFGGVAGAASIRFVSGTREGDTSIVAMRSISPD